MARSATSRLNNTKQGLLRWLGHAFMGIHVALAVAMLAVYAVPFLDPRWFAPLALLGFGYYPLLIGLVVCGMGWLLRRNPRFLLSLLVLLLGWNIHPRFWQWPSMGSSNAMNLGSTTDSLIKPTKQWVVMTYNVGNFRWPSEAGPEEKDEFASSRDYLVHLLGSIQPDLAGFQDFISWDPQHFDVLRQMKQDPRIQGFSFVGLNRERQAICFVQKQNHRTSTKPDWFSGLGLWVRGRVLDFGYHNLGEGDSPTGLLWADVILNGDTLRAMNVHLASNRISPRDLQPVRSLDLQSDTAKQSIFRIFRKIAGNARLRAAQAETIQNHVQGSPYRVVLLGDFNDLPHSFAVCLAGQGLKDSFVAKGRGLGHTYAGGFPSFRIDHIMADPELPVQGHHVLPGPHSDHYPVVAVLGR
jgi:endonuclease/exonuclease/phosphatase family metal-dependent hydrolase